MRVHLKKEDWKAGYLSGQRRQSSTPPEGVEVLSWSSGYIEGKAAPVLKDSREAWINAEVEGRKKSPFDVPGIKSKANTKDILDAVRDSRKGI